MALTDNLKTYYKFDVNGTIADATGNQGNATISGATYTASGKINGAYVFDGNNDVVTLDYSPVFTDYSFSLWVKIPESVNIGTIMGAIERTGTDNRIQLEIRTDGKLNFIDERNDVIKIVETNNDLSDNTRHHIVGTSKQGGNMLLFIDGTKQTDMDTTENSAMDLDTINITIGAVNENGTIQEFTDPTVDELGFWDRILSDDEITELYNGGRGLAYPLTVDLTTSIVSYYKLDDASGIEISGDSEIKIEFRVKANATENDNLCSLELLGGTRYTDCINVGQTNYGSYGFYAAGNGAFNSGGVTTAGGNTTNYKEYRVVIDGTSLTAYRGNTLASIDQTLTRTLGTTVAGKMFYMELRAGSDSYPGGYWDWVKVYQGGNLIYEDDFDYTTGSPIAYPWINGTNITYPGDGTIGIGVGSAFGKLDTLIPNSYDYSGNNNTGTDTNVTYVAGKINKGASFNGTSSRITLPGNNGLNLTGNQTYSMWVNIDSQPGTDVWYRFYDNNGGSSPYGIYMGYVNSGGYKLALYYGNSEGLAVSQTLSTSTRYNIVYVHNDTTDTDSIYVNGSLVGSGTGKTSNPASKTSSKFIGAEYNGSTYGKFVDGLIDEFGVWNRALSTTEIEELYNSGSGIQYPFGGDTFTPIVVMF